MNPLRSLKIQIAIALLMIVALFAGVLAITMPALEEQRSFNTLQNITARLQHTVKGLVELAMNYTQNTPTDEASYQRDVKLYYTEIRRQINLFDLITNAFMSGVFSPALTNREHEFAPQLDPAVRTAVSAVEAAWIDFRAGLDRALGMESKGPRLQQAAHYITRKQMPLVESIDVLRAQIQRLASSRLDRVNQIHWISMLTVVVVTLGILAWFVQTILHPLSRAVGGFRSVAQGDFGYQVPLATTNELSSLTISFNQLSSRLHAIFRLIDRIQQGSDLDDTLRFVAEQLPSLLPLDWVGALFVAGDNTTVTLEKSYRGGQPEVAPRRHFKLQKTLLLKTLENDEPLHIPDMKSTAESNPNYQFLNYLVHTGLRDAIFLPVSEQSPIPGILAFATRKADSYTPEHLELLTNIAKLVTHSFGRTVKLAEHARLAAIGSFASGIAHEMRSPLSTIGLALEYLRNSQLPPPAEKRALLAQQESERLTRLSEEILLYAKPLQLNLATLEIDQFLRQFLRQQNSLLAQRNQHHQLTIDIDTGTIIGDKDRLKQVFLNLASNACEASPEGSRIDWRLSRDPRDQVLTLTISNPGVPISLATMERLFDPFFTTKPSGTGLGLGITRRIVHAHGGEMLIRPIETGTEVRLLIPLA